MRIRSALRLSPLALAAGLLLPGTAGAAPTIAPIPFAAPVKLTLDTNFGGYEPSLVIDHFGNIVVTAHKQNHGDAISPNSGVLPIRAQSWIWMSGDGGKTFPNIPGLSALGVDQLDFGDEGDVAVDDANHTYFIDTKVADISFTRWAATGPGKVSEEYTTPALGTASPVDDRPWVIAHGNGVVQYLANEGDKLTYGPGRYTSYMSYDGGNTFDHIGVNLPDSGWCRPVASHHPGSKQIVVFCTNDGGANYQTTYPCTPGYMVGTLWSYVSTDDGRSFTRHKAGNFNPCNPVDSWPSVGEDAAGNLYALYLDAVTTGAPGPTGSVPGIGDPLSTVKATSYQLRLFRSTDHGITWSMRDVTPEKGLYHYSALDVAPDGTIGIVYYHAKDANSDWYVYSAIAPSSDGPFTVGKASPDKVGDATFGAMGDFFECMFGPDGKLNVVWTVLSTLGGQASTYALNSDIYFAHTVSAATKPPVTGLPPIPPPLTSTPPTGLVNTGTATPGGALAAIGIVALTAAARRRRGRRARTG